MTDWLIEKAPIVVGQRVWLVKDVFEIGIDTSGIVTCADVPVARAFQVGFDSVGIIQVEFPDAGRRLESHWTNFTTIPPEERR